MNGARFKSGLEIQIYVKDSNLALRFEFPVRFKYHVRFESYSNVHLIYFQIFESHFDFQTEALPVRTKKLAKFFGLQGTRRLPGCYFQNK